MGRSWTDGSMLDGRMGKDLAVGGRKARTAEGRIVIGQAEADGKALVYSSKVGCEVCETVRRNRDGEYLCRAGDGGCMGRGKNQRDAKARVRAICYGTNGSGFKVSIAQTLS